MHACCAGHRSLLCAPWPPGPPWQHLLWGFVPRGTVVLLIHFKQQPTSLPLLSAPPYPNRYGPSGSADVMGHAFFKQIDWRKLEARQVGGWGGHSGGKRREGCVHACEPATVTPVTAPWPLL